MKKKGLIIAAIVIAVIYIFATIIITNIQKNLDELVNLTITDVDISKIENGVYKGSYEVFPVAVTVKVTVKNHLITKVDIVKHQNGQGSGANIIPTKVVANQTLDVDIISGATYSSKVMLKAIENALTNANK